MAREKKLHNSLGLKTLDRHGLKCFCWIPSSNELRSQSLDHWVPLATIDGGPLVQWVWLLFELAFKKFLPSRALGEACSWPSRKLTDPHVRNLCKWMKPNPYIIHSSYEFWRKYHAYYIHPFYCKKKKKQENRKGLFMSMTHYS